MTGASDKEVRCAIVLAGGEGKRLRPFVYRLRRDVLPKQYCTFLGTRSMLEHTLDRAEKLIPPDRILTVAGEHHFKHPEVRRQLSMRPKDSVVTQPENKDTGPGILLPLVHLYKCYPNSTVVVFPSDHFIVEEDLFMAYVAFGFHLVEQNPSRLILLGVKSTEPETEYGYILPYGTRIAGSMNLLGVQRFAEKPEPSFARELVAQGGLWNTSVMIFATKTMLQLVRSEAPALYDSFLPIFKAIGTPDHRQATETAYQSMKAVNFSKALLEKLPLDPSSCLCVLPVSGVFWSDWGSENRLLNDLKRTGHIARLQGISEDWLLGKMFGAGD